MTIQSIAYIDIVYYTLKLLIILQDKEMDGGDYKEKDRRGYIPDKNHFLSFYVNR